MTYNDEHLLDMNRRGIPNKPTDPPPMPAPKKDDTLSVNELFISISGEVGIIPQGTLVTVLRLQKCNLRCTYCDAKDSQGAGGIVQEKTITDLVKQINKNNLPLLVTGGEPLLQSVNLAILLNKIHAHLIVQIETNGTIFPGEILKSVDRLNGVRFVMDWKFNSFPKSQALEQLGSKDYLKFVISSMEELVETMYLIGKLHYLNCNLAISSTDINLYKDIVKMVKKTNTKVVINVQIHKFIGVQ